MSYKTNADIDVGQIRNTLLDNIHQIKHELSYEGFLIGIDSIMKIIEENIYVCEGW